MLKRLWDEGLKANKEKCDFFRDRVQFCGHEIYREGLHKPQRIEAVVSAPRAENVSQLHSFLGLVNYYNCFLPNVSIVLHPLHQLLGQNREWQRSEQCELAFTEAKGIITSEQVLMCYDPALPVWLACDASPTGIGAVLSPVKPCGSERPVAFASWSLTKTEHKYAQIDKEALSIMWGWNGSMYTSMRGSLCSLQTTSPSLPFSTQRREFLEALYFGTITSFIKRSMSAWYLFLIPMYSKICNNIIH